MEKDSFDVVTLREVAAASFGLKVPWSLVNKPAWKLGNLVSAYRVRGNRLPNLNPRKYISCDLKGGFSKLMVCVASNGTIMPISGPSVELDTDTWHRAQHDFL